MFLYPWSGMTRSLHIFLEHSHRLVASGVGLITLLVTGLVFATQPRGLARKLAVTASVLVVVQGILGGKEFYKDLGFWDCSTDVWHRVTCLFQVASPLFSRGFGKIVDEEMI